MSYFVPVAFCVSVKNNKMIKVYIHGTAHRPSTFQLNFHFISSFTHFSECKSTYFMFVACMINDFISRFFSGYVEKLLFHFHLKKRRKCRGMLLPFLLFCFFFLLLLFPYLILYAAHKLFNEVLEKRNS